MAPRFPVPPRRRNRPLSAPFGPATIKLRWVGFGEFDDESEYDSLRGHASVAGNPPVPVTYYVRTGDTGFLAFRLGLKSRF